ncbi:hypothetical protein B0H11DRAFT_1176512 [Mycena galericulata]|nr:hypothetical protein B0H11DRAFT_1176512 [Mycena galericulata]
MLHSVTFVEATFAILGIFVLKRLLFRSGGVQLPPGPRPWLGFLALPSGTDREWRTYGKWATKWGEITSVTCFRPASGCPQFCQGSYLKCLTRRALSIPIGPHSRCVASWWAGSRVWVC